LIPQTAARAISFDIVAPDATVVGSVNVDVSFDGPGVVGGFTSTFGTTPSLQAAAEKCGVHHFNWLQVVVVDDNPPMLPGGLFPDPPYIDPAPGGFAAGWADQLPWYWDEGPDPTPTPANWADGYHLDDQTTVDHLAFIDYPSMAGVELPRIFQTFLAGVDADGAIRSIHQGFTWTYFGFSEEFDDAAGDKLGRNIVPPPSPGMVIVDELPLPPGAGYFMAYMLIGLMPGDANLDSVVDAEDAKLLAINWGQYDPMLVDVSWAHGDFDFDGTVGSRDAAILAAHWTGGETPVEATSIPEPSSAIAILCVLWGLAVTRRPIGTAR